MFPYIDFFGRHIPTYGICALIGIAVSAVLIWFMTKNRKDYNKINIVNIPIFAAVGAFIGAHIMYALTRLEVLGYIISHSDEFFSSFGNAFAMLSEWFGGMVFYGGLLGALLAGMIYCKAASVDFSFYADIYAPAIPLFHAFGRIGCFLAGCCYGIESEWGIVYHNDILPEENGVTRIPIQLIESGLNLLLAVVLVLLSRKKLKNGTLLSSYFVIYAVIRFTDEFFRGDLIRGQLLGLSTSQWISIFIFALGTVMLLKRYVIPSTKDQYETRVDTGLIPAGYFYNRYSGMIDEEQAKAIKYGTVEKSTLSINS